MAILFVSGWSIKVDNYYSRDVSGKEIGVYSSNTLQYYNVWSGNEITGRINYENNSRYYYLKDHLGSVRAVIDEDKKVITAQDYDAWGYYLENRMYEPYTTKNKFTGKERDNETSYDYFGARYYDSRVGRWGQMEPAINNLISYSPYSYCILNPLKLTDYGGNFPRITISGNSIKLEYYFYFVSVQSDPVSGLDAIQANVAKELIENMKTWSGSFSILGVDFNISVDASLKEFGNTSFNFMEANISKDAQYYNFVMQANEIEDAQLHQGVGISGDYLKLSKGNKLKPYKTTGAHELGHDFGLSHNDVWFGEEIEGTKTKIESIMGKVNTVNVKEYRNLPSSKDWEFIYIKSLLRNFNF